MAVIGRKSYTFSASIPRGGTIAQGSTSLLGQNFTLNNSDVVRILPVLPYPMSNGKISWSDNFDSQTSGSIEYTGIADEPTAQAIKAAYEFQTQIDLYGIPLEVTNISYTRESVPIDGGEVRLDTYAVSITLSGPFINIPEATQKQAEKIGYIDYTTGQAKALGSGGSAWTFTEDEVTVDGANGIAIPTDGYNHAELSFNQGGENNTSTAAGKLTRFALQEPVREETIEASKDVYLPPENTYVIRDMSLLYDESGDKKVYKKSISIDGKPVSDEIVTTSFVYRMDEVWDDEKEEILSRNVNELWKVIEYRKTDYIYSRIGAVTLNVSVTPPGGVSPIAYVVHPDYSAFVSLNAAGNAITMRSNAEFLVEEVTRGWRLARLKKEDDALNSVDEDPDSEYQPLFEHKPIPLVARTAYRLRSARGLYGEKIEPPFSINFEDYNSADPRIQAMVGGENNSTAVTQDGKIAVLTPDPNFVEPLYVSQQVTSENSFTWANDPDADEPDPEVFIPGTDIVRAPKRLTTGQESYNDTQRYIRKPELYADGSVKLKLYTEMIKEFSSQDPGFDNAIERISFREGSGEPSAATYRIRQYQAIDTDYNNTNGNGQKRHFVTTPDIASRLPYNSGSASAPEAKTISEAINYLQLQLRKGSMQANQRSLTVFGFHPTMRAGATIAVPKDLFAGMGTWRATGITWTLEYKTENSPLGVLVTHPGTQINAGLDRIRAIAVSSEPPDDSDNPDSGSDGGVNVSLEYAPPELSAILENMPNRRNF